MPKINGVDQDFTGRTLSDCLAALGYDLKRVAVERNGEIVPKSRYGSVVLAEDDSLEIVSFVGGG